MINGTRPTQHTPKKSFHHLFGGTDISQIPDFNLDAGIWNPSQDDDERPTECTGYSPADIATDLFKVEFTPDFSFAANFAVTGETPTSAGASFIGAIQGFIAYGALPNSLATISAKERGEIYVGTFSNWPTISKTSARLRRQNGMLNVLGNGDAFSSILSALWTGKIAVSCGSPWFQEWGNALTGNGQLKSAIMPVPANAQQQGSSPSIPWHDYNMKGKKTINGIPYIIAKPWIGPNAGDGGYVYLSQETVNAVLSVSGSAAVTINPNALWWVSIVGIITDRFPQTLPLVPQLLRAGPN